MITNDLIETVIENAQSGPRLHYISDCPFDDCRKPKHFYIKKVTEEIHPRTGMNKTGMWHCKRCGRKGTFHRLLALLNKLHLLRGLPIKLNEKLPLISLESFQEQDLLSLPKVKKPLGFRRVFDDPYFNSRGFNHIDYRNYVVGRTKTWKKLVDYGIVMLEEEGEFVGYLARHVWDKDKLQKHEKSTGHKIPRWKNSRNTEFNKILTGLDEINFSTEKVILVEGFFDKRATDERLDLHFEPYLKCCATNGKDVSDAQVLKMLERGVTDVILIRDPDAINEAKVTATRLEKFFNVEVGFSTEGDLDECSVDEFFRVFDNLKKPFQFSIDVIQKIGL
jgi:hypothetical protein